MTKTLIIGGGVIGLAIARELHKRGEREITIFEKHKVGSGASQAAAGMLAPQAETNAADDFFRFCETGNRFYDSFARELESETGLNIGLDSTGTLYLAFTRHDMGEIEARFEWQNDAGLDVEMLSARETHKREPFVSPHSVAALHFPNDRQVDNRKLVFALQEYCIRNGIAIHENTEITAIETANGISVRGAALKVFEADRLIIANGAWGSGLNINGSSPKFERLRPVRGQLLKFHTAKRLFEHVIYSPRGYIVPRASGAILCGATVEEVGFSTEGLETGEESVKETTFEIAPGIANLALDEVRVGFRPITDDGLPLIGAVPGCENTYVAAGHYRNGILLAPVTANLLVDKIVADIQSEFLTLCAPNRASNNKTNE
ncbi:MAG: glycine oxidase ThiO [Pyrinomonadaceae bacterium]